MPEAPDAGARRNILLFYAGTLLLAIAGGLLMPTSQPGGSLLFILSPLLMVLVARSVLGDGWQDAGLRLEFSTSWRWYLFALLFFPIVFLAVVSFNVAVGWTRLSLPLPELIAPLLGGFAVQLVPRMLFALSEEWAWRGYLEPRLALLGAPDLPRHVAVGVLWGVWHFPFILTTDYTTAPLILFLLLFMIGVILMALIYGRMRSSSRSVWPAVLMHGVGNALAFALLGPKLIGYQDELLGGIQTASLGMLAALAVAALLVWRRRG